MSNLDLLGGDYLDNIDRAFRETGDWRFGRKNYNASSGSMSSQAKYVIPLQLLRDNS